MSPKETVTATEEDVGPVVALDPPTVEKPVEPPKPTGPQKFKCAVLDKEDRLVGYEITESPDGKFVVPMEADLPTDGTYKKVGKTFLPLGFGFTKPSRPPMDDSAVMAGVLILLKGQGVSIPEDLAMWLEWYNTNLKQRNEELVRANKIRDRKLRRVRR